MSRKHPAFLIRSLALAVVGFNATGNYFLSLGMRTPGGPASLSVFNYFKALNLSVGIGVLLLICWLVSQLSLLSWADLTFVLPISATSYVLAAMLGAALLGEHVSPAHWAGIVLIGAGVVIVGRTRPSTTSGGGPA
jgi:uncharacterized membrane protein